MSKYFVHLGLHKTGTTFLQSEVFPRYENIEFVSRPFTQYNHEFNRLQYADDTLFDPETFQSTMDYFVHEKILISDENFSGKIYGYSHINRSMIAKRLERALRGREVEIILVLRGQQSMMRSLYNHWVKSYLKGDRSIDEFFWYPKFNFYPHELQNIENGNEKTSLNHLYYNTNKYYIHLDSLFYYEIIHLYKTLFKTVHVFKYEDLKLDPNSFIEKMDKIIGEKRNIPVSVSKRINASINENELFKRVIQNRYRSVGTKFRLVNRAIESYCKMATNHKKRFDGKYRETLNEMSNYFKMNNQKIIKEFPEVGIQDFPDEYVF